MKKSASDEKQPREHDAKSTQRGHSNRGELSKGPEGNQDTPPNHKPKAIQRGCDFLSGETKRSRVRHNYKDSSTGGARTIMTVT